MGVCLCGVCVCLCVYVFKLFIIHRASSGQSGSLLSMSFLPAGGCRKHGGTRIPGILKSFVLLFNINSPLKFC